MGVYYTQETSFDRKVTSSAHFFSREANQWSVGGEGWVGEEHFTLQKKKHIFFNKKKEKSQHTGAVNSLGGFLDFPTLSR